MIKKADGLVTYRNGEIPAGMATMTMLARQRRRPAPDQPVVGYYKVRRGEVPLYAIAESVELPAMTDKQLARWTANRTCARCEEVLADPVPLLADGRRLDATCRKAEQLARTRVSWLALRMEAVAWARAFIAKRDGVIVVGHLVSGGWSASPVDLLAVEDNFNVLLRVLTWPSPYHRLSSGGVRWSRFPRSVHDQVEGRIRRLAPGGGVVDCDEIVAHLFPLIGRPIVYLTVGGSGHPIRHVADNSEHWSGHEQSLFTGAPLGLDRHRSNDFAERWRDWLAEPLPGQNAWPGRDGLRRQPVEATSAAGGLTRVLVGLLRMSLDDHPGGPAVCPVLPETGLEPCGEPVGLSGTCPGHKASSGNAVSRP